MTQTDIDQWDSGCEQSADGSLRPVNTFEATQHLDSRYRVAFVTRWRRSRWFRYLGASASFTAFRILHLHRAGLTVPGELQIGLVDPRSDVAVEETATRLATTPDDLRAEIMVALSALYDAGHPNLRVFLANVGIEGRLEAFESGVFVTPYVEVNRGQFHPTDLHSAGSVTCLQTQSVFDRVMEQATQRFQLSGAVSPDPSSEDRVAGDEALEAMLAELGMEVTLAELRKLRNERFAVLRRGVDRAIGRSVDYF